jgi:epoxyqueuosine reductase
MVWLCFPGDLYVNPSLASLIKELFVDAGFDDVGSCAAVSTLEMERLGPWIDQGLHGTMGYMARNMDVRLDPSKLHDVARTVVMGVVAYPAPGEVPGGNRIAQFARFQDYHVVIKKQLKRILVQLKTLEGIGGRMFVDTAPAMEKVLAVNSGLGWIGHSSCFFHPMHGSWVVLGGLALDCLPPATPAEKLESPCGECSLCQEACPGQAIKPGRGLDARRCVSYLTLEHKGALSSDSQALLAGQPFVAGCDQCQLVCPQNARAMPGQGKLFSQALLTPSINEDALRDLDLDSFKKEFRQTSVERVGLERLREVVRLSQTPPE